MTKIDKSEAYLIRQYVAARLSTLQHHRKTKDFVKLHHKVKNKKLYRKFVPALLNKFEPFITNGNRIVNVFLRNPDRVKPIIDRFGSCNIQGALEFLSKTRQDKGVSDTIEYNWNFESFKQSVEDKELLERKVGLMPDSTDRDGLAN
jgi:virulence-associated protein VapD